MKHQLVQQQRIAAALESNTRMALLNHGRGRIRVARRVALEHARMLRTPRGILDLETMASTSKATNNKQQTNQNGHVGTGVKTTTAKTTIDDLFDVQSVINSKPREKYPSEPAVQPHIKLAALQRLQINRGAIVRRVPKHTDVIVEDLPEARTRQTL